jgi:uncharacterized zinc-type alcohol dehydrogenase-like protein
VTGDRDRMRPIDDAFDLALCTAHGAVDWDELLLPLRKRGRLVLVGFPQVTMFPTSLVAHELSISGSFLGDRATMPEMLAFAQAHGIQPRVETMAMADVNDAIDRVKENRARYRIVLTN